MPTDLSALQSAQSPFRARRLTRNEKRKIQRKTLDVDAFIAAGLAHYEERRQLVDEAKLFDALNYDDGDKDLHLPLCKQIRPATALARPAFDGPFTSRFMKRPVDLPDLNHRTDRAIARQRVVAGLMDDLARLCK